MLLRMRLDEELDRLYQLPLADFIGARNDLAKRLRADADRDGAERIKKLVKPSLTAWAFNQLHFQARPRLDALREAGDTLRAALAKGTGAHRAAMKARREAIAELLTLAAELLEGAGQTLTRVHRQRLSRTLEAFASGHADAVPGRLAQDLEPPGFDAVSGLAASLAQMPRRRPKLELVTEGAALGELAEVVDLAAERRSRADKAREKKLADARGAVAATEEKLAELERRAAEASAAVADAERLEAEARAAAEDAARRGREARRAAEAASAAAKRAGGELAAAKAELQRLAES
jgi:hypothetical protein